MNDLSPAVPPRLVVRLTLLGSFVLGFPAFWLHHPDLALGAGVGGLFSILNYTGLRALSTKLLNAGSSGSGRFWFWSLLRYGAAAVVFAWLVQISVPCLLGALAVYLWFLGVLFWTGTKMSATKNIVR